MFGRQRHKPTKPEYTPEALDLNSSSLISQIVPERHDDFCQIFIKYKRYMEKFYQCEKVQKVSLVITAFVLIMYLSDTIPENIALVLLFGFTWICLLVLSVPGYQNTVLLFEMRQELKSIAKASNLNYRELKKELNELLPPLSPSKILVPPFIAVSPKKGI